MIDKIKTTFRRVILRLNKSVLKRRSMVLGLDGIRLEVPLFFTNIGMWLAVYRTREPDHPYMFSRILKEGDLILEVGSNIGYYLLQESKLLKGKGTIISCEPDARNVEFLKRNISRNKLDYMVQVNEVAVSDENGEQEFYACESSNLNSLDRSRLKRDYVSKNKVKVVSLESLLRRIGTTVNFMRMDIEGHELVLFRSLIDYVKREGDPGLAPDTILFETHPWEYQDKDSTEELLHELFSLGYRVKFISTKREDRSPLHEHGYKPVETIRWIHHHYAIYEDVDPELGAKLICSDPDIRTACFQRDRKDPGAALES